MSWSYNFGANPAIDYVRLLIADTDSTHQIFQDEEIQSAYRINANVWQSGMFYSFQNGVATLPSPPTSYLRVAALLLDALASSTARLAGIMKILDVQADTSKASAALRTQAQEYRTVEDESGAFVIIEMVHDRFTFAERFWKQVQRTSAPS